MGVCFSTPSDDGAPPPGQRYRQQSIIDPEVVRAMELLYPEGEEDPMGSSDGHITTENQFLNAVRIAAANVQSRIVHGINDDADQFCEPFQHPETFLNPPKRKAMNAWIDDQLQQIIRGHLVDRLPKLYQLQPVTSFATIHSTVGGGGGGSLGGGGSVRAASMNQSSSSLNLQHAEKRHSGEHGTPPPHIELEIPDYQGGAASAVLPSPKERNRPAPIAVPNLAAIPHVVESNDDNNIFTPPYSQGSKSGGGGGNQQQQQAKQRRSVDTTNSTFNNSSTTVVGGIASLWNGAGPMVISGIVDIDLILRVVNAYCRPSSALEYNSDPQQPPLSSPSKVRFMNRRGKVVTLGDALSAFLLAGGKGQSTPQPDLELVPEFLDMTPHMRGLDRQRLLPHPSLQINGSTISDVMSPQSTLQTTTMSVGGASIFSDGNDDRLAMMEDLSDAGEASISSPMSGGSSVVDMSASPYAAHGSPWKERTLNTETLKMHNKLVSAKESQMAKQVQLMTKAAQDAERRPKVLMQLLFGAQVWNSFWAAINRQIFGGNPQASTSSGGGAGGSDDGAFQSEEGDEA